MIDSEKIKSILRDRGMTISELAEMISYSEAGLHKAFKNESIRYPAVRKIADALSVGMSDIMSEKGMSVSGIEDKHDIWIEASKVIIDLKNEIHKVSDRYEKDIEELGKKVDSYHPAQLELLSEVKEIKAANGEMSKRVDNLIDQVKNKDELIRSLLEMIKNLQGED